MHASPLYLDILTLAQRRCGPTTCTRPSWAHRKSPAPSRTRRRASSRRNDINSLLVLHCVSSGNAARSSSSVTPATAPSLRRKNFLPLGSVSAVACVTGAFGRNTSGLALTHSIAVRSIPLTARMRPARGRNRATNRLACSCGSRSGESASSPGQLWWP